MAVIKHSASTTGWFSALLSDVGDILPKFLPCPGSSDRDFWSALPGKKKSQLIETGNTALGKPWPNLSSSAYRAFCEKGDRRVYEKPYFERRQLLNELVIAELVENKKRFIPAIIDGVYLILEERGWQLPAHNSYVRGGKRNPLPDPDRPIIDLFAAETGAQLAMISFTLGDALNDVTPLVTQRIDQEIDRRITQPYIDQHFWWMGNGDEPMNNWTPWCTQNVLLSTFIRSTDQKTRHAVIEKAAFSLDAFLKDYGDDGACNEGALYYRHAALALFCAAQIMDNVAPGVFSRLWQVPKLRNMAEFILYSHVEDDYYINFADSSAVLPPCTAQEYLFGKAVGSKQLCSLAAGHIIKTSASVADQETGLFHQLQALSVAAEVWQNTPETVQRSDIFYPSCGLFIARDDQFVVAVKAGSNDDGHNHNDVGSFTIYKSGRPLAIDVGVETYTAKTFSSERYDIWTMQSAYHNLPSFEGVQQTAGSEFAASDVSVSLQDKEASISMDIAGAYPLSAKLQHYRRNVTLLKGACVEITDQFVGALSGVLSLMLCEKPDITEAGLKIDGLAEIEILGGGKLQIEKIKVTDERLRWAWTDAVYRVLVPFGDTALKLRIR